MNPSTGCYNRKPTAEPIVLKKAFGESPLLQELLPKAALHRASALAEDEKEILIYLIEYGRRAILAESAPVSSCKSPWKPWKLASMTRKKEQASSSSPSSGSCAKSSVVVVSSRTNLRQASSTCDCFSCYSIFWSRWNDTPNRDLINDILDVVEESPKSSKVKRKKRADKKRGDEATAWKSSGGDGALHSGIGQVPDLGGVADIQISDDTSWERNLPTGRTIDVAPKNVTQTLRCAERKKSMFRGVKQKEEASATNHKSNKASGTTGSEEEKALAASGLGGGFANGMDTSVHMEVSAGNFTFGASEVMAASLSPALLSSPAKNVTKLHRIAKRRHSQVIPLDCEELSEMEREQEVATTVESIEVPMSPRAADIGLGGRGFLARVFPDTLGRVATRLWDLVSVRLRSRSVEYH